MSWADKKAVRAGAGKTALQPAEASHSPASPSEPSVLEPAPPPRAGPSSSKSTDALFGDFPATLEVLAFEGRGRTVFAKVSCKPGDTIVVTTPLVSVLDNENLATTCSGCLRAEIELESSQTLLQCTGCKVLKYCSTRADWMAHKLECVAMQRFTRDHRKALGRRFPDTPIRALGRLLWTKLRSGPEFWEQVCSLQSHRPTLSSDEKEKFYALSAALASYVGQEIVAATLSSGADMLDLCCRFTTNTFSLTSTRLSNIGVSISPLTALFNHSCAPNSVVVFPSIPTAASPHSYSPTAPTSLAQRSFMRVVAIRPIAPGEEVLTSYIDLTLPSRIRQRELKTRYLFDCVCTLCSRPRNDWIDPRESLDCPRRCGGRAWMPDISVDVGEYTATCSKCGAGQTLDVEEIKQSIEDLEATNKRWDLLSPEERSTTIDSLNLPPLSQLSQSSYPLPELQQNHCLSFIDQRDYPRALKAATIVSQALRELFKQGHPARGVAQAKIVKLMLALSDQDKTFTFSHEQRGLLSLATEAVKEVEVGFGRQAGVLQRELRECARQIENEITAQSHGARRTEGAQSQP